MNDHRPVNDPAQLRAAFACFPSGVAAVCALVDGAPVGLAVSSFTSVSLAPPLVSICVRNESQTWPVLRKQDRLGLSILAEHHDHACRALSSQRGDRFADIDWLSCPDGSVLVRGSTARMVASVHAEFEAGDHRVILLALHHLEADPDVPPLIFHGSRFRTLAITTESAEHRNVERTA